MKKALVIVLTLVLALSVVAVLASCSGKTYEGEYSYKSAYWTEESPDIYGCKVKVTVQGNVITKVVVEKDTEHYHNLSPTWTDNYQESGKDDQGKTNWRLHGQEMAESFVGLTVEEVLDMKVFIEAESYSTLYSKIPAGQPCTNGKVETIKYIPTQVQAVIAGYGDFKVGATQSSGRLVLAIQDALLQANGDITKNPNCVPINNAPKAD